MTTGQSSNERTQDKGEFFHLEDSASDHPFVEKVWRCHTDRGDTFLSVAANSFEMVFTPLRGKSFLTLRGPETGFRYIRTDPVVAFLRVANSGSQLGLPWAQDMYSEHKTELMGAHECRKRMERHHLGLPKIQRLLVEARRVQATTSGRNSMSKKIVVYSQPG